MKTLKMYASLLAIAVGLILTSCVKDTESASVSKLRESKVKLNEAQAALNAAQADAAKLTAEAAKIQADAEKLRAESQIILDKAYAASLNATTAADSAWAAHELDAAKKELALREKAIELEIAEIAVKMEQAEINAQIELEGLRAQLKLAKSDADESIRRQLTNLISSYTIELNAIQSLKDRIASNTLQVTEREAKLTRAALTEDSLAFVNEYKAVLKAGIRNDSIQKDHAAGYLKQWQDLVQAPNASKLVADKKEEIKKLEDGLRDLLFKRLDAEKKQDEKRKAYDAAWTALDEYTNLLDNNGTYVWGWTDYVRISEGYKSKETFFGKEFNAASIAKDGERHYVGLSNDYQGGYYYIPERGEDGVATGEIFVTCMYDVFYVWEIRVRYYWSWSWTAEEEIVKSEVKRNIEKEKQYVASYKQDYDKYSAELATLSNDLNAAISAEQTAEADYKKADDAYKAAEEALSKAYHAYIKALNDYNAKTNPTDADRIAVNDLRVLYDGQKEFTAVTGGKPADPKRGAEGKREDAAKALNAAYEKCYVVARNALEAVKSDFQNLAVKVADAKIYLDNSTERLATYEKNYAILSKDSRANLEEKADAAWKEYEDAIAEYSDLYNKYVTDRYTTIPNLNSEVYQLELYYDTYGRTDGVDYESGWWVSFTESYVKERIEHYTSQIGDYQKAIDEATANLKDITKTDGYKDRYETYINTINSIKSEIANLKYAIEVDKERLIVREANAATLKANIDELLKSDETTGS